jgi:hypothetical protein
MRFEIVLVSAPIGARFAPNILLAWKSFWTHPMILLGDVDEVEAHFGLLEKVLISAQDRCTVCDESTTGMEITLGTPDGTLR